MEAQISMHSYKATNQITYFLNLKITAFGGKKKETHQTSMEGGWQGGNKERRQAGSSLVTIQRKPLFMFWYVVFFLI